MASRDIGYGAVADLYVVPLATAPTTVAYASRARYQGLYPPSCCDTPTSRYHTGTCTEMKMKEILGFDKEVKKRQSEIQSRPRGIRKKTPAVNPHETLVSMSTSRPPRTTGNFGSPLPQPAPMSVRIGQVPTCALVVGWRPSRLLLQHPQSPPPQLPPACQRRQILLLSRSCATRGAPRAQPPAR